MEGIVVCVCGWQDKSSVPYLAWLLFCDSISTRTFIFLKHVPALFFGVGRTTDMYISVVLS